MCFGLAVSNRKEGWDQIVKGWDLPAGSSLSPVPRPPVGLGQAMLVVMVLFLADYFFYCC